MKVACRIIADQLPNTADVGVSRKEYLHQHWQVSGVIDGMAWELTWLPVPGTEQCASYTPSTQHPSIAESTTSRLCDMHQRRHQPLRHRDPPAPLANPSIAPRSVAKQLLPMQTRNLANSGWWAAHEFNVQQRSVAHQVAPGHGSEGSGRSAMLEGLVIGSIQRVGAAQSSHRMPPSSLTFPRCLRLP